jgi:prevent-host-death family protein
MKKIGLKELNQQTSRVIARVRGGERLVITDHGRDVAMLVPIVTQSAFEKMLSAGQVRPATSRQPLNIARVKVAEATDAAETTDAMIELRFEERGQL